MTYNHVDKEILRVVEVSHADTGQALNRIAESLKRGVIPVSQWINGIGVGVLTLMMFLTAADVILRYIFNRPITGSLELTEFMMVILVAFGMAYTAVHKGHITIDVATSHFNPRVRAVINSINSFITISIFALIAWRSIAYAQNLQAEGYVSASLFIPTFPFVYVVAVGSIILCSVYLYNLFEHLAHVVVKAPWQLWSGLVVLIIGVVFLFSFVIWNPALVGKVSPITTGVIVIGVMVVLIFLEMPIGVNMAVLGFLGMVYVIGQKPGLTNIGTTFYSTAASYNMSVVPLFVLMGLFCFYSGISKGLYQTVYKWIGHLPGGLAIATVGACAGFAAVSGSSVAVAATMGTVSLPEMKKHRYGSSLATACIAAGGCLGILIPPSTILAIYGLLTSQSIGKLFLAGFLPGILEAILFIITIYIVCKRDPLLGPPGGASNWIERVTSLKNTWAVLLLFVLVIGGLYAGLFTPTEAAGVGAFGAFVIALALRKLSKKQFKDSLLETGSTTAMIFVILIGANILGFLLAVSRLPSALSDLIVSSAVNRWVIMAGIIVFYLLMGCIMSSIALIVLTVPIFFPIITALGFNPIWFGIIIVKITEVGQMTPPVAINVFVIQGIARDVPMYTIFRGIVPFIMADIVEIVLLCAFPQIATVIPNLMQ